MLLMLASIALNYLVGLKLQVSASRSILGLGVAANLAILLFYKYANFLTDNLNVVLGAAGLAQIDLQPVHLPLGISFFTFQAISYLVDLYRREIEAQRNILDLGLYIALFPQLIAGPIVRYKTIMSQISDRKVTPELFASGAERFTLGLAKKLLIANPLGYMVDIIFALPADQIPTHVAWFGILLYALQIYFDFSGYSDMAIGLGRMFGFKFLENFNYPYIARSVQDFWRRWHISLSTWFRDYLYIPLGGNRVSPIRLYLNLYAVFLLCGLWHGASWNFFIWGAFHGTFLTIERLGLARVIERLWRPLQHVYLLFVILVSWVFFRADTLGYSVAYLKSMLTPSFSAVPFEVVDAFSFNLLGALILGLIISTPVYKRRRFLINQDIDNIKAEPNYQLSILTSAALVILLIASAFTLASSTHNPFIYFRF